MKNIFNFSIVSSFLGLWITTHVPESFELILGFILIFTFGMIHGSNDLLIVNKILKNIKHYSKFTLLAAYLLIVSDCDFGFLLDTRPRYDSVYAI